MYIEQTYLNKLRKERKAKLISNIKEAIGSTLFLVLLFGIGYFGLIAFS